MAQGQAVGGGGEVRQQDVRRAAREGTAKGVHGLGAAVQRGALDGIAGLLQRADKRGRGAAFFIGREDKNVKHGDGRFRRKASRVAAGEEVERGFRVNGEILLWHRGRRQVKRYPGDAGIGRASDAFLRRTRGEGELTAAC